jgi:hypothetical protein
VYSTPKSPGSALAARAMSRLERMRLDEIQRARRMFDLHEHP